MKNIIIALLLVLSTSCFADSFDLTVTSWHSDKTFTYNNKNFGIGYTKTINNNFSAKIGYYKNSFFKKSLYAFASFNHKVSDNFSLGVDTGFVSGYDNISLEHSTGGVKKYQPIAFPTASYHINDTYAITSNYIPSFNRHQTSVIGFQFRYNY